MIAIKKEKWCLEMMLTVSDWLPDGCGEQGADDPTRKDEGESGSIERLHSHCYPKPIYICYDRVCVLFGAVVCFKSRVSVVELYSSGVAQLCNVVVRSAYLAVVGISDGIVTVEMVRVMSSHCSSSTVVCSSRSTCCLLVV